MNNHFLCKSKILNFKNRSRLQIECRAVTCRNYKSPLCVNRRFLKVIQFGRFADKSTFFFTLYCLQTTYGCKVSSNSTFTLKDSRILWEMKLRHCVTIRLLRAYYHVHLSGIGANYSTVVRTTCMLFVLEWQKPVSHRSKTLEETLPPNLT
jgi:hypothetical protein